MAEAILSFLANNWTGGIWLALGFALAVLYFRLRGHSKNALDEANKAKTLAADAHDKINKLPCEKHSERITSLQVINAKLDGILQTIQSFNGDSNQLVQAHSPINLTQKGLELKDELKLDHFIDANWANTCSYIESHSISKNPYDIQQLCFDYTISNTTDVVTSEGADILKSKAFEIGIPSINLLQVVSIVIRDRYFKEHGLNLADVDKHDPDQQ